MNPGCGFTLSLQAARRDLTVAVARDGTLEGDRGRDGCHHHTSGRQVVDIQHAQGRNRRTAPVQMKAR